MFTQIEANLTRQFKSLELLQSLLDEEFELLSKRDIDAVTALEFSIHELLRQIARERMELKEKMQGVKLLEYATMLPDEEATKVTKLFHLIDGLEQRSSRQASQNAEMSLALMDQSQSLLTYLHNQITPRPANTYGAAGRMKNERPSAAIFSGRF